jgi:hypothetical protein
MAFHGDSLPKMMDSSEKTDLLLLEQIGTAWHRESCWNISSMVGVQVWSSSIYKRWAWTIAELIVTWLFEPAHAEWIFPATLSTNTEQLLWIYGLSPKFTYKVVQPMARWAIPTSPGYPHKSKPPTRTNRRGKLEMLTETGTLCLLEVWTWVQHCNNLDSEKIQFVTCDV